MPTYIHSPVSTSAEESTKPYNYRYDVKTVLISRNIRVTIATYQNHPIKIHSYQQLFIFLH